VTTGRGPRLACLPGGREVVIGSLRVVAGREPPFPIDAVVIEDDVERLLGAPTELRDPGEDLPRLTVRALNARRERPGAVLAVPGTRPLRLHAIVHDLEREPSWRIEWVREALAGVFEQARRRRLRAIGLPPLGAVHGRLPPERVLDCLRAAMAGASEGCPARLWFMSAAERGLDLRILLAGTAHDA